MIKKTGSRAAAYALLASIGGFAASIGLSSTAHAAAEPGWYVGIDSFATKPEKSDAKVTGIPGSDGTTGVGCLIPINLLGTGLGIDLGAGCLIGPGTPGTPATNGLAPQSYNYDYKWGWGIGGNFGYRFENGLRPELDFNYSTADVDSYSLTSGFANADGTPASSARQKTNGHVNTLRLMSNLWYDLDFGKAMPYFGGGIGVQSTDTKVDPTLLDDKDTTFAYQLGAGIGFALTDDWVLSIDYRYVDADKPKYSSETTSQPVKTEYQSQNVGLSLKYAFGENGGRDSDGDGVPDRLDQCPNTPKGVTVYSNGCPTDLDQDGVPDYLDKCPGTPAGAPVNAEGCPIDSDGDGVPDHLDQCPGTPPNTPVDPKGCPLDADGDGVPDYLDRCPNTPKGTKVGADGCAFLDSDGDGVPDALDKCPNSPRGQPVGPDGCPLDSDGDGIPDFRDECPNTPPGLKVLPDGCALSGDCRRPKPGEKVDARGCALDKRFVLRGVKFEYDSDRLTAAAKVVLNDVAATLSAYPQIRLDVEGHTDSQGTEAYNLGLSERRANSVIRYLGTQGATVSRLKAVGYGESVPIDSNETETGRENNRRVEFKVTDGD